MQGLLEVITIDGEFLWALFGAENVHHLAKADHMHRLCSKAAAVDVGHVWKHQLLTLHTTCAHSFAVDLIRSLHPLGLFTLTLLLLIVNPGIVHISHVLLVASPGLVFTACPGTVHIGLAMLIASLRLFALGFLHSLHPLGLYAMVFLCSLRLLELCIVM